MSIIDPYWARAWKTVLRGQEPGPPPTAAGKRQPSASAGPAPATSAWTILGLAPGASLAEVKRAFQRRALETHPDQGGAAEEFQRVQRAYEKLRERLERRPARTR